MSLQFLSGLGEFASLFSAPPLGCGFDSVPSQACHSWLHMAPGNDVFFFFLILRDTRRTLEAKSTSWGCHEVKREEAPKMWNMVPGMGECSTTNGPILHSEKLPVLVPFSLPPNPRLCRSASPNLGCSFSGYYVPLFVAPITAPLYFLPVMMLWWAPSPPAFTALALVGLADLPLA